MEYERTQPAGGSPINRVANASLSLPAGSYSLRYTSDARHDASGWSRPPPDGRYWGVSVFEE